MIIYVDVKNQNEAINYVVRINKTIYCETHFILTENDNEINLPWL